MRAGLLFLVCLLCVFPVFAAERLVRIGEVFFVDQPTLSVIISGKNLENVPEGEILKITDAKENVLATVKVTKNNAATLRASFVSGQFSLIREKMPVVSILVVPDEKPVQSEMEKSESVNNTNKSGMVDPVDVKILDEGNEERKGWVFHGAITHKPMDPREQEYQKRRMGVGRLIGAEFAGLCLPGSGLGHYIVKDPKGGILVNILAGSALALTIANEYSLEYWDAYRKDSAELYSIINYSAKLIFVAGYLYDLIDTPIKWNAFNKGLRKELGLTLLPSNDGGAMLSLYYKF